MLKDPKTFLVPKLRFPEFRNEPPWVTRKLGELFRQREETGRDDLRLLSLTDKEGIIPQEESNRKNNASVDRSKYLRVARGDIVYNTMRMWEGRSALATLEGIVSPAYTVCEPCEETNSLFFAHYFKTSQLVAQFARYSQGLVKDTLNLKFEAFARILAATPSPAEQQKIAECLSTLDELIGAESQKLDALKDHKKGLMQQLFPREGETRPRLRFPEFRASSDWERGVVRNIATVLQGYGFPEKYQGNTSAEFPFYKVSDISRTLAAGRHLMDEAANYIDHETLEKLKAKPIPAGTTIFAKIGEALRLNRRALTTRPCLIDNNTAGVKAIEEKATDLFLYYLFSTISLEKHAGGVVPAVSKTAIEEIEILYPKRDEQARIATFLSSIDDLIAAQSERLEALRAHKRGLMQQLFPNPSDFES
jgi:Restriction endonuclease S subunits